MTQADTIKQLGRITHKEGDSRDSIKSFNKLNHDQKLKVAELMHEGEKADSAIRKAKETTK